MTDAAPRLGRVSCLPLAIALDALQTQVQAIVAERLGAQAGRIDPQKSFVELGFDSVEAVLMCGAIEECLGIAIDPVLVFESRSLAAFVWAIHRPYQDGERPPA